MRPAGSLVAPLRSHHLAEEAAVSNISGLPELDAAIGLAFMFFLLAVATSSINELIASFLGWRAKTLEDGIRRLLQDPAVQRTFKDSLAALIGRLPKTVTDGQAQKKLQAIQVRSSDADLGDLTTTLFENWRIQALVRDPSSNSRRRRRPSYLAPEALSRALVEHLAMLGGTAETKATKDASTARPPAVALEATQAAAGAPAKPEQTLWQQADDELFAAIDKGIDKIKGGSPALSAALAKALREPEAKVEAFRVTVEGYFNDTMARASGWYKRKVQWVLLILAVVLAVGLNINTVHVASRLWKEPALRSAVATQATKAAAETTAPTAQQAADDVDAVHQLNLPVGWGKANRPTGFNGVVGAIVGWLIAIAAISLGAPFWFDLLSRLARLRGSGSPDSSRQLSDKNASAAGA
jgi:hypothetical protein